MRRSSILEFRRIDTNGDSALSFTEFLLADRSFIEAQSRAYHDFDLNGDNRVTRDEFEAFHKRRDDDSRRQRLQSDQFFRQFVSGAASCRSKAPLSRRSLHLTGCRHLTSSRKSSDISEPPFSATKIQTTAASTAAKPRSRRPRPKNKRAYTRNKRLIGQLAQHSCHRRGDYSQSTRSTRVWSSAGNENENFGMPLQAAE